MTVRHALAAAAPWLALAGTAVLGVVIVAFAPQAGSGMLTALIVGWTILGVARVLLILGLAHKLAHHLR